MLEVKNLSGGYPGNPVLEALSFSVEKGELFGILGPNGSGKTTLLKMLSGLIKPHSGKVEVDGKPISSYTAKELARKMAVLPQLTSEMFAYSVKETVALGRYAHQRGLFQSWSKEDEAAVMSAMESTGVRNFAEAAIQELSGGERQRVFLAQALAQEPEILLLDEPTNHLDLSYQKELLDRLASLAHARQLTVVSIFHDMNLAGLYCDRLLLLKRGEMQGLGVPFEILRGEEIGRVYKTDVVEGIHPNRPRPQLLLQPEMPDVNRAAIRLAGFSETERGFSFRSSVPLRILSAGGSHPVGGWHRKVAAEPNAAVKVKTGEIGAGAWTGVFAVSESFLWVFIEGRLEEGGFAEALAGLARLHPGSIVIGASQCGADAAGRELIMETEKRISAI